MKVVNNHGCSPALWAPHTNVQEYCWQDEGSDISRIWDIFGISTQNDKTPLYHALVKEQKRLIFYCSKVIFNIE